MYLKLITEGTVVHWAGDDQEVEDPENKSVGDPPKLFCFFLGHPDFGVRAWVMHTGSSGGAVGAWRAGLMISVTAYSERSLRMTTATTRRQSTPTPLSCVEGTSSQEVSGALHKRCCQCCL
jgi:hypothetical protein